MKLNREVEDIFTYAIISHAFKWFHIKGKIFTPVKTITVEPNLKPSQNNFSANLIFFKDTHKL